MEEVDNKAAHAINKALEQKIDKKGFHKYNADNRKAKKLDCHVICLINTNKFLRENS